MRKIDLQVALVSFFSFFPLWATETPPSLIRGDEAFRHRASIAQAKEALDVYRTLYKVKPENPEIAWRVSMACYFAGLRVYPEGERVKIFAEGRDAGKTGLLHSKDCAPCHFWTAINMALYGREVGVFKMFFSLSEIREHLHAAMSIDPGYAQAGAQRLLGTIEENLPGILGGSDDRAREYYEKAIRTAPDEPMNYLFLAKLLFKKEENRAESLKVAQRGSEIAVTDSSRLESFEAKDELSKFLSENQRGVQAKMD